MRNTRLILTLLYGSASLAQVNVLTSNYDNNRTNANPSETLLNTWNVNSRQFGKVYSFAVDGQVYAQPLYVHGLSMPGKGTLDVLFVATMHNSVFAFDADARTGTSALWRKNFGTPANPAEIYPGYDDIENELGILSTPVIDSSTNTLYVVANTEANKQFAFNLHALDLLTGAEKFNGPVLIQGTVEGTGWGGSGDSVNGKLAFNANQHLQRPGLLLLNGSVYLAFGSHGDWGPWHGWLMGYNASNLQQQTLLFNATPSDAGASIWQGGRGLAADDQGNIYFSTGNGGYDGSTKWGESLMRMTPDGTVADWFTPADWGSELNPNDNDFGSNGPILVPRTNLIVAAGKAGVVALVDRTNMGHEVASDAQIVQSFQAADTVPAIFNSALWSGPSGNVLYIWGYTDPLRAYRMVNGKFQTTAVSVNTKVMNALPCSGFTVSSNGQVPRTGILWATTVPETSLPAPGTLRAFDASNVATELWDSDMNGARDTLGGFIKYANPTVANGKVFVPTGSDQISVYGLLPNVPGVASVVNAASFFSGTVAPGELITIFGDSIGPNGSYMAEFDPVTDKLPFELGGTQVAFGAASAPLLFGDSGQINAVVPFGVAGQSSVTMRVSGSSGQFYSVTLPLSAAAPAIFTQGSTGTGQGAVLNNVDMSLNSPSNPAAPGSVVDLYITGAGITNPESTDGLVARPGNLPLVAQPITITIGGQPAKVVYEGAAPGLVAGLTQVDVEVPENITTGRAVPVTLMVGTTPSQNTVTIAVR